MTTYSFAIILAGVNELTNEMMDAIFEAGCDDSTPSSRDGQVTVYFDREAKALGEAIGSAVADILKAGYRVSRIEIEEPDLENVI